MIEDEELRRLFAAECEERLERLESGLLTLERGEVQPGLVPSLMREAHSLKGSARMLGVTDVETVAHRLEDLLMRATPSPHGLPAAGARQAYALVDALRALVKEAVTGEPSHLDVPAFLASLQAGAVPAAASQPESAPGAANPAEPAQRKPEVVRVRAERLDALLKHAGELNVLAQRASRRVRDAEDLDQLVEDLRTGSRRLSDEGILTRLESLVAHVLRTAQEDETQIGRVAREMEDVVREVRLVPFASLFAQFPRMVRDIALEQGKEVRVVAEAGETAADRRIVEELKEPLMHLLRNAVDHGVEPPERRAALGKPRVATISLRAQRVSGATVLELTDDGCGIDPEQVRESAIRKGVLSPEQAAQLTPAQVYDLLYRTGFSTSNQVTAVSGRGVGLDAVRASVERLKGSVELETRVGAGTTFRIRLPLSLATSRAIVLRIRRQAYAIPDEAIEALRIVPPEDIFTSEGREAIRLGDEPVPVARLADLLRMPPLPGAAPPAHCVVLRASGERVALLVDELVDEQELLVEGLGALLQRVRHVAGAAILNTGEVCLVLNPNDLVRSMTQGIPTPAAAPLLAEAGRAAPQRRPVILLAEDSITTRTQERRILEAAGFEVVVAVDGLDALTKLQTVSVDAIVTDVEMPRMDGLALAERVRRDRRLREIPIVLVTSLASEEDRRRGFEVGADAYLTKSDFNQEILVETLRRLVL